MKFTDVWEQSEQIIAHVYLIQFEVLNQRILADAVAEQSKA
jgi:hypothetical protein